MAITFRRYNDLNDYKKICEFLQETYLQYGTKFYDNITLFQFQCGLSCGMDGESKEIDEVLNDTFLWFDGDKLVAKLSDDSFCIRADYRYLFTDIIELGEKLSLEDDEISWGILDGDEDFERTLIDKGYHKTEEYWVSRDIDCDTVGEVPKLPEGFYVKLVPELENCERVYKAYELCYGILFNQVMFDNFYKTSTYKKELDIVIMNPDNEVVALCSGRYDELNKMASIEAVSCYKEYRRRGISKAMILYVLNEAKKLGAKKATVLTAMPERCAAPNRLYDSIGFKVVGNSYVWKKSIKSFK